MSDRVFHTDKGTTVQIRVEKDRVLIMGGGAQIELDFDTAIDVAAEMTVGIKNELVGLRADGSFAGGSEHVDGGRR